MTAHFVRRLRGPYTAPLGDSDFNEAPNYLDSMARREGLAIRLRRIALRGRRPLREPPTLRFEDIYGLIRPMYLGERDARARVRTQPVFAAPSVSSKSSA